MFDETGRQRVRAREKNRQRRLRNGPRSSDGLVGEHLTNLKFCVLESNSGFMEQGVS